MNRSNQRTLIASLSSLQPAENPPDEPFLPDSYLDQLFNNPKAIK